MDNSEQSRIEALVCRAAGAAGFGSIEDVATRRAVGRLIYVAGCAWGLSLVGTMFGLVSPLAGMAVLSLVMAIMAGGVLLGAKTNIELATMLATSSINLDLPERTAAAAPAIIPPAPRSSVSLPPPERKLLTRGEIDGRSYAVFSDGSIEMETIFGQRWFASIDLAHEFIGFRNGKNLSLVTRSAAAQLN